MRAQDVTDTLTLALEASFRDHAVGGMEGRSARHQASCCGRAALQRPQWPDAVPKRPQAPQSPRTASFIAPHRAQVKRGTFVISTRSPCGQMPIASRPASVML